VDWVELRGVMEQGWAFLPSDRPPAAEILNQLENLPGYTPKPETLKISKCVMMAFVFFFSDAVERLYALTHTLFSLL
jgi:hypothetical protein